MPGRMDNIEVYRFGFQRQESDPEYLDGAIIFKYRIYDPRIGRFLSIDPLTSKYPYNSPYAFSENRIIDCIELEGLEKIYYSVADRNKYEGFDLCLKLLKDSGILNEISENFRKENKGVDIYIVVGDLKNSKEEFTDKYARTRAFFNDPSDLYNSLKTLNINNWSNLACIIDKLTFEKDKYAAFIVLDIKKVTEAKDNDEMVRKIAFSTAHEMDFHGIDLKDRSNDVPGGIEHKENYGLENPSDISPSWEAIKEETRAGDLKKRIESTPIKREIKK